MASKIFRTTCIIFTLKGLYQATGIIESDEEKIEFRAGKYSYSVSTETIEDIINNYLKKGVQIVGKCNNVAVHYTKGMVGTSKNNKAATITLHEELTSDGVGICFEATDFDEWFRNQMRKKRKD